MILTENIKLILFQIELLSFIDILLIRIWFPELRQLEFLREKGNCTPLNGSHPVDPRDILVLQDVMAAGKIRLFRSSTGSVQESYALHVTKLI